MRNLDKRAGGRLHLLCTSGQGWPRDIKSSALISSWTLKIIAVLLCIFMVPLSSVSAQEDQPAAISSPTATPSTIDKSDVEAGDHAARAPQADPETEHKSSLTQLGEVTHDVVVSASKTPVIPDQPEAQLSASSMLSDRSKVQEALAQTTLWQRIQSFLGILGLLFITWLMSAHRRRVDWRLVSIGVSLQFLFGVLILVMPFGRPIFDAASAAFTKLLNFTKAGSGLIFGAFDQLQDSLLNTLAFGVLPTIIFFSSLMAVLYHLGIMQWVVNQLSWMMQRTMRTSGSETLSAAANIFVGQTEAPLMVRPYVSKMTMSELMAVMVGGFATVAGGVLAIYVGFLEPHFPGLAGHLLTASVMSAPAALVIAKVLYPEVERSETAGHVKAKIEKIDANLIDAAARGAGEGLTLTLNVAAMLLAFVALIAALNYLIAMPSYLQHHSLLSELWAALGTSGADLGAFKQCVPESVTLEGSQACLKQLSSVASAQNVSVDAAWHVWSFQEFFGYLFAPLAMLIGIPYTEAWSVGQLLGVKVVLNELIAYQDLTQLVKDGGLSPRSVIITSYALCGFANFGSIAIQIGGIGGIAPDRRGDLARLGVKAMWGGTLAALMTGAVVGVLL